MPQNYHAVGAKATTFGRSSAVQARYSKPVAIRRSKPALPVIVTTSNLDAPKSSISPELFAKCQSRV
jgi:hypothetical protein